jgi:NTE family protein
LDSFIKYNCIFGGGGVRGLCYVGALKALQECNIEIDSVAGSSVGAVFAALYAVGYSYTEIREMFLDFNFHMFRDININIFDNDLSFSKGEIFLDWLRDKFEKKVFGDNSGNKKVTFKDIDKHLQILALDISTNTPYIFSKNTTPDEEIALAVRISAGMPGLMKPVNVVDSVLVDGDLIKSRPAWKVFKDLNTSESRVLEFRLEGSKRGDSIKNPLDYLNTVISTIWYLCTEEVYENYHDNDRYDYIVLDTKDVIMFDFTIDKNIKENLIELGYKDTKNYLKNVLVNKRKKILEIYKIIFEKMQKLTHEIKRKNPESMLFIINDILSDMDVYTKYIDISIFNKIKEFKELVIKNTANDFLFSKRLNNIKFLKERNDFINMLIEERINDIEKYINYCNNC